MTRICRESRSLSPHYWLVWWRRGCRGASVHMHRAHEVAAIVVMCTFLIACGGSRGDEAAALLPDLEISETSLDAAAEWQGLLNSPKDYAGAIIVGFADDSGVRYADGAWRSNGEPVEALSDFGTRFPNVLPSRVITELDEATIDQARANAAAKGVNLPNYNRWYRLPVTDPVAAEALLAYLFDQPQVAWAHPEPIPKAADTTPLPTFPSGGPGQDYLIATNGGLNIKTAWDRGLTGAGQVIFDVERSWNYTHADLHPPTPMYPKMPIYKGFESAEEAQSAKHHGTAVLGILAGKSNAAGVTGIAHGATIYTATGLSAGSTVGALAQKLEDLALGIEAEGRVVIIEQQMPGPGGSNPTSLPPDAAGETNCPGCLPLEAYALEAWSIKALVDLGTLVFEAAGNGAVDLDNPSVQAKQCGGGITCPNLATADTGAVLVGASTGPSVAKHPASNCGKRVNAFAWGANVVTTGYGDYAAISAAGDENAAYTKQFGGTSAATAIYGGIGALLQEYVQQLYTGQVTVHPVTGESATPGSPVLANQLQDWQKAYLSSADFRALLTYSAPGQSTPYAAVPQTAGACSVGFQLDVGKAMEVLFNGWVLPTMEQDVFYCGFSANATCVSACDADIFHPKANCGGMCQHAPDSPLCAEWCYQMELTDGWDQSWYLNTYYGKTKMCGHVFLDSKKFDVDGDGRGDLIAVDLESTPAKWYVDRSGANITESADGFGAWDLIVDFEAPSAPPGTPNRIFPVVADYNRDGRSDLALYHSDTGHWVIKYTEPSWVTPPLLFADLGTWDIELDLAAANPGVWQAGSRPFVRNFDWSQHLMAADDYAGHRIVQTLDISLVTPDGHWLMQYGDPNVADFGLGGPFAIQFQFLDPAALAITQTPPWAYLPVIARATSIDFFGTLAVTPETLPAAGKLLGIVAPKKKLYPPTAEELPLMAADGHHAQSPSGLFYEDAETVSTLSVRDLDAGSWWLVIPPLQVLSPSLMTGFGGVECQPAVADYDDDGFDDRAVLCPNGEWRIAYSTQPGLPLHEVHLGNPTTHGLPGESWPIRVPMSQLKAIYAPLKYGCTSADADTCTLLNLPAPVGPEFAACLTWPGVSPLECLEK